RRICSLNLRRLFSFRVFITWYLTGQAMLGIDSLWFVVCGLWFVVCGLWFENYSEASLRKTDGYLLG
ncbi:hypothetical protein, partial [Rhodohalobacter sulfatireducens]